MNDQPNFSIQTEGGFQIKLPNGKIVSVQFSAWHYCSNKRRPLEPIGDPTRTEAHTAEIAVIDAQGNIGEPESYCDPARLLEILAEAAR